MSNGETASQLLLAQQLEWERGSITTPLDTLQLLNVAMMKTYGEHNFDAINAILSPNIPDTQLKTLRRDVHDLSADTIVYYDLDQHMCRHIASTYSNKDLPLKECYEQMLQQTDMLYIMITRLSQAGHRNRFQRYSLNREFMHAITWFYFTFDALHVEMLGKIIYLIHIIITQLSAPLRIKDIINPLLLRDMILGRAQRYPIMRMINACGIIGHLSTDSMSYDLTNAALGYCLTGKQTPMPDLNTENRILTDSYLAIFLGLQYASFHIRYLGVAAASIFCETNSDLFNAPIVQTYLTKKSSIAWFKSSPPGVLLLRDILLVRGFKNVEDRSTESQKEESPFAGASMIKCCLELRKNQYTSVFFNTFLKMLLSGEYGSMHKQHLLTAGIIRYFFYALSEYFSSQLATIACKAINGIQEYNIFPLVREYIRARPWVAKRNTGISVPPDAISTAMYEYQEMSTNTHIVATHSIFLKLVFRFFLVQSPSDSTQQFPVSYLLSPTELSIMRFSMPPCYDTFGCGSHPLTSKGFISTLIDLFIYMPLSDTRRQWIYIIIACLIKGALSFEKSYFSKYKIFDYVINVLKFHRSWLDLSIPDFEKETISALDILGALIYRNTKFIQKKFDSNPSNAQLLLECLTHSVNLSSSCLRSCVQTVAEVVEEYRQVFKCSRTNWIGLDLSTSSSSTFMTGIQSNTESRLLHTVATNWVNIISFLFTMRIEALQPPTISIITTALTMLDTAQFHSEDSAGDILRSALLGPLLYLKIHKHEIEREFTVSEEIRNIFADRGIRFSRQKITYYFQQYCKEHIDTAFKNCTEEELKAMYQKYSKRSPPFSTPASMSKCGTFEMRFPWENIMNYLAELSLRSHFCVASLNGAEWNLYGHALLESQTLDNILYNNPCPNVIITYRMMRAWLMTSLIRTDRTRWRAYGANINIPRLRVICQNLLEELRLLICEVYGHEVLKRLLNTEGPTQPILFDEESNE
ncbi:hypothetical protein GL50803_0014708 [Giardia duodenalis]|uniref:Uncharacterized protein n=1 Tax=Giardia intestinalis (strain ATCC 50803 / WB clone C6) TaxID=184922 RepID=D3KI96_GIAIC|nr:hypothetical protein GL50803_0014708 [Giardia intestinalis]KAE8304620.1 hypothetical protein GL50803_0014708 [Giardia intestinalis]